MEQILRLLIVVACMFATYPEAISKKYYFSTLSGNDSRSLTQAQNPDTPLKSINKLNQIMPQLRPGDSVLFKRGEVFYGSIIITQGGSNSAPLVFSAYGAGPDPVISGFSTIQQWTPLGNGIYESSPLSVESPVNMVSIDGQNRAMGRFPNPDEADKGYLKIENTSGNRTLTNSNLSGAPNFVGGEAAVKTAPWIIDRSEIIAQSGSTISVSHNSYYWLKYDYGFFIQNHINTLDRFGEWYFNPQTARIAVFFGDQSPADHRVQVSTIDKVIDLQNDKIVIEKLHVSGGNRSGIYDRNYGEEVLIQHCRVSFSGQDAIDMEGTDFVKILNCTISESHNNGLNLNFNCKNAEVRNNTIINTGLLPGMGKAGDLAYFGLLGQGFAMKVVGNRILNTGYIPLLFGNDSTLVKYNYIDSFCLVKSDGGGIYSVGQSSSSNNVGRLVESNIVLNGIGENAGTNSQDYWPAEGIYLDDNATGVKVIGNTVANCGNNGIYLHNARNIIVEKNTFFNNRVQFHTSADSRENFVTYMRVQENILFSKKDSQKILFLNSYFDDIDQIGVFDNNNFSRPLDNGLFIQTNYYMNGAIPQRKMFNLQEWKNESGNDLNSSSSPLNINPYAIHKIEGGSLFPNSEFTDNIDGLYCWWPSEGGQVCNTSWLPDSELDGACLEVDPARESFVALSISPILENKQYLLRFSAKSAQPKDVQVYLRQNFDPYQTLSEIKNIKLYPERREYEIFFHHPIADSDPILLISSINDGSKYWIDNVKLQEAEVMQTKTDGLIRFEYNPSLADTTISLNANYLDVNNNFISGDLTLGAFQSIILLSDTADITILPFESAFFTSEYKDCKVDLKWRMPLEPNFSHFELEKSEDGVNFKPIAEIPGVLDNNSQQFHFTDKQPKTHNYYRLKKVNSKGSFTYSKIVYQKTDCTGLINDWKVFPNIISKQNPEITSDFFTERSSYQLFIIDQLGRIIRSIRLDPIKGWNTFRWNLGDLPSGAYFIQNPTAVGKKAYKLLVRNY